MSTLSFANVCRASKVDRVGREMEMRRAKDLRAIMIYPSNVVAITHRCSHHSPTFSSWAQRGEAERSRRTPLR